MAKKSKLGIKVPSLNEIKKKYGHIIRTKDEMPLWLPSRFLAFNHQCGGGIPYGKIMEIMGEESSGKSLLAYDFAYCCQQLGGKVIWVDAEQAWTDDWAEKNGLNPKDVFIVEEVAIETIADVIAEAALYFRSILVNNEPILLVVDSIATMDSLDNINSKMTDSKAEMGTRAKSLYKMLRIRSALFAKLGITQLYINQLRTALNVGFGKDNSTTTGGAALKFYSSIRVACYSGAQLKVKIKGKDRRVGKYVTIRSIKNKVAPPGETISKSPVYFRDLENIEIGFDRYFGLLEVLIELGVITKSSSGVIKYRDKVIARGEDSFLKAIKKDDKLRKRLIRASNINTISLTEKNTQEIKVNLFPINQDTQYEKYETIDDEEDED